TARSGVRHRLRAGRAARDEDRGGPVQLVRLRRHERDARVSALSLRKLARLLVRCALALAIAAGAYAAYFVSWPIAPPRVPFDFTVKSGASLKAISRHSYEIGRP